MWIWKVNGCAQCAKLSCEICLKSPSQLAEHLAASLNVPYIDSDSLLWNDDWIESPDAEIRSKLTQAIESSRDGWVLAGNIGYVSPKRPQPLHCPGGPFYGASSKGPQRWCGPKSPFLEPTAQSHYDSSFSADDPSFVFSSRLTMCSEVATMACWFECSRVTS
ncbi:hypothetical protein BJ742DRAFT_66893 [Cladochytrium replicatum]|nr:hypothetical protein BJ742DRAFT_66893 [Cladochytrium replicatum]